MNVGGVASAARQFLWCDYNAAPAQKAREANGPASQ